MRAIFARCVLFGFAICLYSFAVQAQTSNPPGSTTLPKKIIKKRKKKKKILNPVQPMDSYVPAPPLPTYKYNLRLGYDPIPFVLGTLHIDADYGFSRNMTVGPTLFMNHASDASKDSLSLFGFGIQGNYYIMSDRYRSGFFVQPMLAVMIVEATSGTTNASASTFGVMGQVMAGYQYFLKSGFNFTGGLGLAFNSVPSTMSITTTNASGMTTGTTTTTVPGSHPLAFVLELGVGYAF